MKKVFLLIFDMGLFLGITIANIVEYIKNLRLFVTARDLSSFIHFIVSAASLSIIAPITVMIIYYGIENIRKIIKERNDKKKL